MEWIVFNVAIFLLLLADLFLINKKGHKISFKEAVGWTFFWIGLAVGFNILIYFWKGEQAAIEFLTGYLIEESLSVDNLFVFLTIFTYFNVPASYQHRILFWGILGAFIIRAVFILAGIALVQKFQFVLYLFGVLLVIAGIKVLLKKEDTPIDMKKNIIVRSIRKYVPILRGYHGEKFFIKRNRKILFTPLFMVLIVVESTDIIFAFDSIPAILSITKDPFIVYTSNVFAILGLRTLFFAISRIISAFYYLNYGLAFILIFVGVKLSIHGWIEINTLHSLIIVISILLISFIASIPKFFNNK